jgi:hypothetical protein
MTENKLWEIIIDDNGDCFVVAPDGIHKFFFGDMEDADGCCFRLADFIVKACNKAEEENNGST